MHVFPGTALATPFSFDINTPTLKSTLSNGGRTAVQFTLKATRRSPARPS